MEEVEMLLADLNKCIAKKESELLKIGPYNIFTRSYLKLRHSEIKLFEIDFYIYRNTELLTPTIIEKMEKEYNRIKTEIGKI